jgi:hypothetical protein
MSVMRVLCLVAVAAALTSAAAGAGQRSTRLPRPLFVVRQPMLALAASGANVAVASGCDVRVANVLHGARPVRVPQFGPCAQGGLAAVDALYLGRSTLVAEEIDAESPHGEDYTLWSGPVPRGPLRALDDKEWGWRDDDMPSAYGCQATVVQGGGVLAVVDGPNTLGLDSVVPCAGVSPTKIRLLGASRSSLAVPGSWSILATDGRRLVLRRLDSSGSPTGELRTVALDGTRLPLPRFDAKAAGSAFRAWLVGRTLLLQTSKGISGPGWTIKGADDGVVGQGRLIYRQNHVVRVRRLRDGVDRALVRLPTANALLAGGSFGLAVATGIAQKTYVYRLPWRTIDRTLR